MADTSTCLLSAQTCCVALVRGRTVSGLLLLPQPLPRDAGMEEQAVGTGVSGAEEEDPGLTTSLPAALAGLGQGPQRPAPAQPDLGCRHCLCPGGLRALLCQALALPQPQPRALMTSACGRLLLCPFSRCRNRRGGRSPRIRAARGRGAQQAPPLATICHLVTFGGSHTAGKGQGWHLDLQGGGPGSPGGPWRCLHPCCPSLPPPREGHQHRRIQHRPATVSYRHTHPGTLVHTHLQAAP